MEIRSTGLFGIKVGDNMIWGKTLLQRNTVDSEYWNRMRTVGTVVYAWFPTHLRDGRWVWLEDVCKKWGSNDNGDPNWIYYAITGDKHD
jgi:hypothetical protein